MPESKEARERRLARVREKRAAQTLEEREAARNKKREAAVKRRAAARALKPDESDEAQWARVEAVRKKVERWKAQEERLRRELGAAYKPPTREAA